AAPRAAIHVAIAQGPARTAEATALDTPCTRAGARAEMSSRRPCQSLCCEIKSRSLDAEQERDGCRCHERRERSRHQRAHAKRKHFLPPLRNHCSQTADGYAK